MIQPGPSNPGVSGVPTSANVANVGVSGVGGVGNVGNVGPVANVGNVGQMQRTFIWSGVLEWMEKGKAPGEQQKVTKHLPCQVQFILPVKNDSIYWLVHKKCMRKRIFISNIFYVKELLCYLKRRQI